MNDNFLAEKDHIVRYVKPSHIDNNGKVSFESFRLDLNRPNETGLSVNWLEAFGSDKKHKLNEVRRLIRLKLRKNGRFAELKVGSILQTVSEELKTLLIIHDPLEECQDFEANPSHSEILNLPQADTDQSILIGELIAECIIVQHPALS